MTSSSLATVRVFARNSDHALDVPDRIFRRIAGQHADEQKLFFDVKNDDELRALFDPLSVRSGHDHDARAVRLTTYLLQMMDRAGDVLPDASGFFSVFEDDARRILLAAQDVKVELDGIDVADGELFRTRHSYELYWYWLHALLLSWRCCEPDGVLSALLTRFRDCTHVTDFPMGRAKVSGLRSPIDYLRGGLLAARVPSARPTTKLPGEFVEAMLLKSRDAYQPSGRQFMLDGGGDDDRVDDRVDDRDDDRGVSLYVLHAVMCADGSPTTAVSGTHARELRKLLRWCLAGDGPDERDALSGAFRACKDALPTSHELARAWIDALLDECQRDPRDPTGPTGAMEWLSGAGGTELLTTLLTNHMSAVRGFVAKMHIILDARFSKAFHDSVPPLDTPCLGPDVPWPQPQNTAASLHIQRCVRIVFDALREALPPMLPPPSHLVPCRGRGELSVSDLVKASLAPVVMEVLMSLLTSQLSERLAIRSATDALVLVSITLRNFHCDLRDAIEDFVDNYEQDLLWLKLGNPDDIMSSILRSDHAHLLWQAAALAHVNDVAGFGDRDADVDANHLTTESPCTAKDLASGKQAMAAALDKVKRSWTGTHRLLLRFHVRRCEWYIRVVPGDPALDSTALA